MKGTLVMSKVLVCRACYAVHVIVHYLTVLLMFYEEKNISLSTSSLFHFLSLSPKYSALTRGDAYLQNMGIQYKNLRVCVRARVRASNLIFVTPSFPRELQVCLP